MTHHDPILLYFTPSEQAWLKGHAANIGLDLSTYIRVVVLTNGVGRTRQADIEPVATPPVAGPAADAPGSVPDPFQRKSA